MLQCMRTLVHPFLYCVLCVAKSIMILFVLHHSNNTAHSFPIISAILL